MVAIEKLFGLDGKVALVTGGYGGIGEAVSRGLACSGAKVAISGHQACKSRCFRRIAEGRRPRCMGNCL